MKAGTQSSILSQDSRSLRRSYPVVLPLLVCVVALGIARSARAQVVTPAAISIVEPSPVCSEGSVVEQACIALPPAAIIDKVDVFFLFDDTGSFAGFVPTVTGIFSSLVSDLETAVPGVEFGFGVGRFEDYGGPGTGFSGESTGGRPFILNQPIVTAAGAGGAAARDALIGAALGRTAPGFGGDGPESDVAEGLYQVATGAGFDGNGDGLTTGVGGTQVAGALATQTAPDANGDVPAFSTLDASVVASGSVGGAGFRSGALRLVILATDICSVAAFAAAGVPATISGTGGTEPVAEFACSSTTPGDSRFGFVSDSKTSAGNTIAGAVVPSGAGTVPATVAALNAAGIRVIGMGPAAGPVPSGSGPSFDPSVFLSAVARLTGAVDAMSNPLVFSIGGGGTPLKNAIAAAITTTTTLPVDITLMGGGTIPTELTVGTSPAVVPGVPPGGEACFDVTFTGTGSPSGSFDLNFKDNGSGAVLGTIPVDVGCEEGPPPPQGAQCEAAPQVGCRPASKSSLLIKQKGGTKDKLVWKWLKGQATSQAEFGDPLTSTDYALCIYAGTTSALLEESGGGERARQREQMEIHKYEGLQVQGQGSSRRRDSKNRPEGELAEQGKGEGQG